MSVSQLRPRNIQNARSVGVNEFVRFLEKENISQDYVFECLARDPSGRCFATTMDKFAMHLEFAESAKGKTLAANTVMSYFRNVKNWLLAAFPQCKAVIEERVLEMVHVLEKHCKEREIGGPSKQANPCTKADLARMVQYLYANGTTPSDYQDAALIRLMWFVFGRASDLSLVQKDSISVCANTVLFVRLMRVKTSEQQGLTLYPDEYFKTAPCVRLLENVHPAVSKIDDNALRSLPLMKLLTMAEQEVERLATVPPLAARPAVTQAPGINNQVNRLLTRIQAPASVPVPLSSHSFRREGA